MSTKNSDDEGSVFTVPRALLTASAGGFALADDPVAFVEAVILTRLRDIIIGLAGESGARFIEISSLAIDAIVEPLQFAIGRPISWIAGSIVDGIGLVEDFAVSVGSSAGPLSIIVIPLVFAASILGLVALVLGIWRAYIWIRSVIV